MHVHTRRYACTRTHTHATHATHTSIHTHIHTYIHTYIHTHIHTLHSINTYTYSKNNTEPNEFVIVSSKLLLNSKGDSGRLVLTNRRLFFAVCCFSLSHTLTNICIYMYVCVCVCVCMARTYIFIYIYVCVCMYVCMYVCIYIFYICICVCVCMYVHNCVCV